MIINQNVSGGGSPAPTTNYTMAVVSDIVTLDTSDYGSMLTIDPTNLLFSEISFPKLETITENGSLASFAQGNETLARMSFPSLTTIEGEESFRDVCNGCQNLVYADLHNLTTVSGRGACIGLLQDCPLLTSIDLSNLTTVGDYQDNTIDNCFADVLAGTGITELRLPSLVSVGYAGLATMCSGCLSLVRAYFNSIDPGQCDVAAFGTLDYSDWIFSGCDNLVEIHFPAGTQSAISQWNGYSENFGATNATIYFDL